MQHHMSKETHSPAVCDPTILRVQVDEVTPDAPQVDVVPVEVGHRLRPHEGDREWAGLVISTLGEDLCSGVGAMLVIE